MFTITAHHCPSENQVLELLHQMVQNESIIRQINPRDPAIPPGSILARIKEIKDNILAKSLIDGEINGTYLQRVIERTPFADNNIIHDQGNLLTVAPVGLFALTQLFPGKLKSATREWTAKMKNLQDSRFWANGKIARALKRKREQINRIEEILERKTAEVLEATNERNLAQKQLKELKAIEPKYCRTDRDPDSLPGAYETATSLYAQRYNRIAKMDQLLSNALNNCCADLLKCTKASSFFINRSEEIVYSADCEAHRTALISYAVLTLLDGAALVSPQQEGICHGDPKVVFNDQDLFIQDSKPINIPLTHNRPAMILFENPSSWAEKPDPKNYPQGIDPISTKLILHRLTPKETRLLEHLILDPFMPLCDEIREAYKYRDQNSERGDLVRIGYNLIHTMARALWHNYRSDISKQLAEIFNDDKAETFKREEIIPLQLLPDDAESPWMPNFSFFPEEMREVLLERKKQLSILWNPITGNHVEPPLIKEGEILSPTDFKAQLSSQYYIKHNFLSSSCRIDALTTLLFQETPEDIQKPKMIMAAIANYLDIPANRKEFEEKIQRCGFTVEKVQQSYRTEGKSLFEDDLEIELAAHALGITIKIFAPGVAVKHNQAGLVEPVLSFGPTPSTQEKLFLASDGGLSFYALEPKLRISGDINPELTHAISSHKPFWENARDHEEIAGAHFNFLQELFEAIRVFVINLPQ